MDSAESTDIIERLQYGVDVVQSPGLAANAPR
jgi:hypothetical protein